MRNRQAPDEGCSAIMGLTGLDACSVHRFVVGSDAVPVALTAAEVQSNLNDPFAVLLLAQGTFPKTAAAAVDGLKKATGDGNSLTVERSFLLGEGSQIPLADLAFDRRTLRFVVALGDPVDVIVSAFSPSAASIELMAWDASTKGFNFYRTASGGAWVFAGNSMDAVRKDTEGKGPFESHTSGSMLMKELRFPWVHWHSFKAPIETSLFEGQSGLTGHRWLRAKGDGDGTLAGADECEEKVVKPSIGRWTKARFEAVRSGAEPFRPRRILKQVVTSPTVNLVSSQTASSAASRGDPIDLPPQFFVDAETLSDPEFLGLEVLSPLSVPAEAYAAVMDEFKVSLRDCQGFSKPGDTHFAFVVPERALEDIEVVKAASGFLFTRRLAACLLMVDFPNPVFSARRASLLQHAPLEARFDDPDAFSETMAATIRSAAEDTAEGSGQREFTMLWDDGERWPELFNARLRAYYDNLTRRLEAEPLAAFHDWFRLAEATRRHARKVTPIFEFPLLLASSKARKESLAMLDDATVIPR